MLRGSLSPEERGPLLDGLVLHVLRAHAAESDLYEDLSHWSPAQAKHTRVDFLLRRGSEHIAIEVKAGARFQPEMLCGLRAVADLPRLVRRVVVHTGRRSLTTEDGIEVWPFSRFARVVASGELWP